MPFTGESYANVSLCSLCKDNPKPVGRAAETKVLELCQENLEAILATVCTGSA